MPKGDFWFPLFYQKLLTSTIGWKDDQFGAYIKLLIYQYDKGFIPNDKNAIARISQAAKKHWSLLSVKFEERPDGNLINPVMDAIRRKRLKVSATNSKNGKSGGRPVTKKETEIKPNGYKNEKQYNISIDSNSPDEKIELSADGFFSDEIEKDVKLSETQIGATVQFVDIKTKNKMRETDVEDQWEAFKIDQFSKHEWYNSFEDLLSHFRHSIKKELSGSKTNISNNSRGGTSEERTKRNASWGLAGKEIRGGS